MPQSTAEKYSHAAERYDRFEYPMERILFGRLRVEALSYARGETLEVGVGTGKNLPYYPSGITLSAIDFSPGMLQRIQQKGDLHQTVPCRLSLMDAQNLGFGDNMFDTIVSTFVFCTVPDPLAGLREVYRVLKPDGRAIFLEHMRSEFFVLNLPLFVMNVFSTRLLGTSMLRETQKNIERAGFTLESVDHKFFDVVRLILAQKP